MRLIPLRKKLFFFLVLFWLQPLLANEKEAELKSVQNKITELKQDQSHAKNSLKDAQSALAKLERSMGNASKNLRRIKGEEKSIDRKLGDLSAQKVRLEADLISQRDALALQIRMAYQLGNQEQIKLLLNQQDPAKFSRTLVYYRYLNTARSENITTVQSTLSELDKVNQQMTAKKSELAQLANLAAEEQQRLVEQKANRKALLASISDEIQAREDQIGNLRKNEKELQDLLKSLQSALTDIPEQLDTKGPFSSNRGKLAWPVTGIFEARFGQARNAGDSKWRGMLIRAAEGREVRAIAPGRVAFADWLKGYGLLIIVDHGDGYMSLYGHNQSLFKTTGDWVVGGDLISSVGNTGGQANAGLYFEIRMNGEPVDPSLWCRQVAAK